MIILIPLGGKGVRFTKSGYKMSKPLINIMGKPILYWLLDNLDLKLADHIIIPYNNILSQYHFEYKLTNDYPDVNFHFFKLENESNGAADTVLYALNRLTFDDQSILCLDGDNFYLENIIKKYNNENCVFTFIDNSYCAPFSYISLSNMGNILDIAEKKKISSLASTGAYGFKSWIQLREYCKYIISNNIKDAGEYYISTVIKSMIKQGIVFVNKEVNINNYVCLGTPLQCRLFCNNFPVISALTHKIMLKPKKYCFDINLVPKNIDFLKYLKKMGHTIIIYDCYNKYMDLIKKYDIPYDDICSNKPLADYYIDNDAYDLQKELGYYYDSIKPREFNTLTNPTIQTYRKSGKHLSGEIYYYLNIPVEIKDMFPIMWMFDSIEHNWYEMEKINGIPVSILYLSEELTIEQFNHIYNSINRIHKIYPSVDNNIDIYANYIDKLKFRYANYNYSQFEYSDDIYSNLLNYFMQYKYEDRGIIKVIHGDPVFTNILINQFGKIKFIDMRGKQGDQLSIYGDWLYDWGKLYQSLVGYDEILVEKYVDPDYKYKFLAHFKKKFIADFGNNSFLDLVMVTKLLLFTLIPLHDNIKCSQYYSLIRKI